MAALSAGAEEKAGGYQVYQQSADLRLQLLRRQDPDHNYLYQLLDSGGSPQDLVFPGVCDATNYEAKLLRDGTVLMLSDGGGEWNGLWLFGGDQAPRQVVAAAGDIESFAVSPSESLLAFGRNESGCSKLYLAENWRTAPSNLLRGFALPPGQLYSPEFISEKELKAKLSTLDSPEVSLEADLESGKLMVADRPTTSPAELRTYLSADGLPLSAWYLRAPVEKGLLIFLHGGPQAQFRPVYSETLKMLRAHGWSVLAPNVRGSRGLGRSFMKLDDGAFRADAVKDVLETSRYARCELGAKSLTLVGTSYGAYLAFLTILEEPKAWENVILHAGPYQIGDIIKHDRELREYGPAEAQRSIDSLVGGSSLGPGNAPEFLILHGGKDRVVEPRQGERLDALLRSSGVRSSFQLLLEEGHGFDAPPSIAAAMLRFLDRH